MEQANFAGNPIADPMGNPMGDPMRLLIARTDGRTNERVNHLPDKSSSYVLCAENKGISSSTIGGE